MKVCTSCKQAKSFDAFNKHGLGKDGLRPECRECQKASGRAYRIRNAERERMRKRAGKYQRRYGLTLAGVEALHASVGHRCEACGRAVADGITLAIDHDHACCPTEITCGQCIRGVLCIQCNIAFGMLHDDIARVEALADYARSRNG